MNDYITLTNSNSSLSKRFRVIQEGYAPVREKIGSSRVTITGKTDNQVGAIQRKWRYVFLVYETDPVSSDYGTLGDLKTFFGYNAPGGTPSNVITLNDFDHDVTAEDISIYLVGMLSERPFGPMIDGVEGIFNVSVEMVEVAS